MTPVTDFIALKQKRQSRYLLEPTDLLYIMVHNGRVVLADINGQPCSRDFVELFLAAVGESYAKFADDEIEVSFENEIYPSHQPTIQADPQKKPGIVYVLEAGGKYKIGRTTRNIEDRVAQIQRNVPWKISIVAQLRTNDTAYLEAELHEIFGHRRTAGEWFSLSDDDVAYIKSLGGAA